MSELIKRHFTPDSIPIVLAGLAIAVIFYIVLKIYGAKKDKSCTEYTRGTVNFVEVKSPPRSGINYIVYYKYSVDGVEYNGIKVFNNPPKDSREAIMGLTGKGIQVRYNPKKPKVNCCDITIDSLPNA
ncbi:MAG: hypothetical protein UFA98_10480 [Ruminococcus sp.]|nr:hypothetical protein [Ruminococcus sp.]